MRGGVGHAVVRRARRGVGADISDASSGGVDSDVLSGVPHVEGANADLPSLLALRSFSG